MNKHLALWVAAPETKKENGNKPTTLFPRDFQVLSRGQREVLTFYTCLARIAYTPRSMLFSHLRQASSFCLQILHSPCPASSRHVKETNHTSIPLLAQLPSTWGNALYPFDVHLLTTERQVLLHKGMPLRDSTQAAYGATPGVLSSPRGSLRSWACSKPSPRETQGLSLFFSLHFALEVTPSQTTAGWPHWLPRAASDVGMGTYGGGLIEHVWGKDTCKDAPTVTARELV